MNCRLVIFICFIIQSSCLLGQSCDNNLISINHDFEDPTDPLNNWQIADGVAYSTTDAYEGTYALVAEGVYTGVGNATPIFIDFGLQYVITGCSKVEGTPTNAGFGVSYFNFLGALVSVETIHITNTNYECHSLSLTPPPGAIAMVISVGIDGPGKVYVDDLCLEGFSACDIGAVCDDDDPNTSGDVIDQYCECRGSACGVFADAGNDVSIQQGSSVILTASGGSSYSWSTNETTQSITVQPTTTTKYYVTVSESSCSEIDSVIVNIIQQYDIRGLAWEDLNGNGCRDSGEPPIPNAQVDIYNDIGIRIQSKNTDANGNYSFSYIPGDYELRMRPIPNFTLCPPSNCGDNSINNDYSDASYSTSTISIIDQTVASIDAGFKRDAVVPTVLTSFFGRNSSANSTELTWKVDQEVNTEKYIIEKSTSRQERFVEIGMVRANNLTMYSFTDRSTDPAAVNHYRLKMVDYNASFEYSHVISVDSNLDESQIRIFPNPVSDRLYISGPHDGKTGLSIAIFSLDGRMLLSKHYNSAIELQDGIEISSILQAGTYLVNIIWSGGNSNELIVKN